MKQALSWNINLIINLLQLSVYSAVLMIITRTSSVKYFSSSSTIFSIVRFAKALAPLFLRSFWESIDPFVYFIHFTWPFFSLMFSLSLFFSINLSKWLVIPGESSCEQSYSTNSSFSAAVTVIWRSEPDFLSKCRVL